MALFVLTVQVLAEDFGHREHVYAVLFEDRAHGVVAPNLSPVARVLKLMLMNVLPQFFHCLRAGKLSWLSEEDNPKSYHMNRTRKRKKGMAPYRFFTTQQGGKCG